MAIHATALGENGMMWEVVKTIANAIPVA